MSNAAYFRAWRAAHPRTGRARTAFAPNAGAARAEAIEPPSTPVARAAPCHRCRAYITVTDDLFERARRIVGPRGTTLVALYDPLYDDLLSEATLALLEGRDAEEAIRRWGARERSYLRVTCPILDAA